MIGESPIERLDLVMGWDLGGAHGMMDGFSTGVAKELFARRPEWERHASEEPGARPGGPDRDHCLWVRFPGSPRDDEHLLELATYDDEITVSLGPEHLHMGEDTTLDGALERLLDRALALVDDLLSERLVAATRRLRIIGLTAGGFDTPEGAKDDLWWRVIKVRSWNGTHDRDT